MSHTILSSDESVKVCLADEEFQSIDRIQNIKYGKQIWVLKWLMIKIVIFQDFVPLFHMDVFSGSTQQQVLRKMYYDYEFGMLKLDVLKQWKWNISVNCIQEI